MDTCHYPERERIITFYSGFVSQLPQIDFVLLMISVKKETAATAFNIE